MNAYVLVIVASLVIIASYLFNIIAKRTNVPSVLMLIALGVLLKQGMGFIGLDNVNWFPYLEVLGIVGLIMIVLEAALDLELTKEKRPLIIKSLLLAFFSLFLTVAGIAYLLIWIMSMDFLAALLYAIPISVMSSAIVIPSVSNLHEEKREFMIYESTFSDILGIMMFYFVIGGLHADSAKDMWIGGGINILITVAISFVVSYTLIIFFQNLKSNTKLFLLIAVLLLLYSVAKLNHLSPLLLILVFGLILNNRKIFFKRKLASYLKEDSMKKLFDDLFLITLESSFVVRTFFFVLFGLTISLASLFDFQVILVSLLILIITYGVRFVLLKIIIRKNINPQLLLAPRGLITVLLFYAIPKEFQVAEFDEGILLFIIIVTSILMAVSLIRFSKNEKLKLDNDNQSTISEDSIDELGNVVETQKGEFDDEN